MWRRLESADFERASSLMRGRSESTSLSVCDIYEIRGDEVVAKWPQKEVTHWWWYDPLVEAPDLFLELAALTEASDFPEAALAFSHKRGLLGGNSFFEPAILPDNNPERISLFAFELEASLASFILKAYEAALNRDEEWLEIADEGLERFVTALGRRNELDPESLEDRGVDEGNLEPSEGLAQSVLAQVAVIVNKVVQKRCYMFPHFTKEFPSPKTVTAGIRSSWGFDNLLGAAYLQMWWLMTSGGDVTRCENCRRIMSLARTHPNGRKRRRDKRFCSDSCRQAHHRSKKRS